jgi:hypothetical protein
MPQLADDLASRVNEVGDRDGVRFRGEEVDDGFGQFAGQERIGPADPRAGGEQGPADAVAVNGSGRPSAFTTQLGTEQSVTLSPSGRNRYCSRAALPPGRAAPSGAEKMPRCSGEGRSGGVNWKDLCRPHTAYPKTRLAQSARTMVR